jgi:hypothetical protein
MIKQSKETEKIKEQEDEKAIKIEDTSRIEYSMSYENDPNQEFSGRILDFENGEWRTYERANFMGTHWYPTNTEPDKIGLEKIRKTLEPIARHIGIELTEEMLKQNNPKTFIEKYCKFIGEQNIKVSDFFHTNLKRNVKEMETVRKYELIGNPKVKIKLSKPYVD